jgi:hypothetical protein
MEKLERYKKEKERRLAGRKQKTCYGCEEKKMKITKEEFLFAISLAVLGFIFSAKEYILWLNQFNPFQGLLVYYIILYSVLFVLAHFGLIIWKFKIETPAQVLGAMLITFAFFIVVDWTSCYTQTVVSGSCQGISSIYLSSEDGAVYYLWSNLIQDTGILRLLTYVFTPFVMALAGVALVSRVKIHK